MRADGVRALQSIEGKVEAVAAFRVGLSGPKWTVAVAADEPMEWFAPPPAALLMVEPPIAEAVIVDCSLLPVVVVPLKLIDGVIIPSGVML